MAGFVGTAAEHQDFCRSVGPVPWIATADFLDLARVIAGSELFVGNQSCPSALAEGLKHTMILEVYPPLPNCGFARLGRLDATGDGFELPVIECKYHCLFHISRSEASPPAGGSRTVALGLSGLIERRSGRSICMSREAGGRERFA